MKKKLIIDWKYHDQASSSKLYFIQLSSLTQTHSFIVLTFRPTRVLALIFILLPVTRMFHIFILYRPLYYVNTRHFSLDVEHALFTQN